MSRKEGASATLEAIPVKSSNDPPEEEKKAKSLHLGPIIGREKGDRKSHQTKKREHQGTKGWGEEGRPPAPKL